MSRTMFSHVLVAFAVMLASVLPAAPSRAVVPLEIYGKLPGFEMAALSPDGERIALIGLIDDKRHLVIVDSNNQLLHGQPLGDQKIRALRWGGNDRVLLDISSTVGLGVGFTADKAELTATLVIPIAGKAWSIFDGKRKITGGVSDFFGVTQRDGRWYGYFSAITLEIEGFGDPYLKTTSPHLYEVDLLTGDERLIGERGLESWRDWVVGKDGKVAAVLDYFSRSQKWQIKNGVGQIIVSGTSPTGAVGLLGLGQAPDKIIYTIENSESGEHTWFEIPQSGGTAIEMLPDLAVHRLLSDPIGHRLIGYELEADVPVAKFYDPRHNKIMAAVQKAFPDVNVHLLDWTSNMERLIVRTNGDGDPGSWWFVDIKTGKATDLGVSYPLSSEQVGPVRMIPYKAADGLEMAGVLTLPPGRDAKSLPIVIFPHGGPSARDYPTFDWWAQAFASRGYAVFQPNFRGSTGYGAAFEQASEGQWGRKMQSDISDGLAELVRLGIVDPKRACIMGASYGGYAALAGVTLQHGLYRCAVAVAGVSDVQEMYRTDVSRSGGDQAMIRSLKRNIGAYRSLKDISPANFADKADAPILLVHGKDDTVVLFGQSSGMAAALKQAGKPYEFVVLKGEDHWLSKGETRLAMLKAALEFVMKHNPPDEAK